LIDQVDETRGLGPRSFDRGDLREFEEANMEPRVIRWVVIAVFVTGIAGMIVGSIKDSNAFAATFGLITTVAAINLMVIAAVGGDHAFARQPRFDEATANDVETRIAALTAAGAPEAEVRDLVRIAVRLGRSASSPSTNP
jgi:uncharacterized membrane protein